MLVWGSAYTESFKVADFEVGASARGMDGYGGFAPPPPFPILGIPRVGSWGGSVLFARLARLESCTYTYVGAVGE
jgi:hypothetical protein